MNNFIKEKNLVLSSTLLKALKLQRMLLKLSNQWSLRNQLLQLYWHTFMLIMQMELMPSWKFIRTSGIYKIVTLSTLKIPTSICDRVYAHESLQSYFKQLLNVRAPITFIRAAYQFGIYLEDAGHENSGIGISLRFLKFLLVLSSRTK